MSDSRDTEDQLKITDADADVSSADRTEAHANSGSGSTQDDNVGVLGDVAHPFDQTNGIVDEFDEHVAQNAETVTTPGGVGTDSEARTDAVGADDTTSGRHAAPVSSDEFGANDGDVLAGDDDDR